MRSACIPLLLICVPVWAADWVSLQINSGDQYFYDNSKLVIKDDEITYWKKVLFKTPQIHKGSEVSSGVLRERIHCGEHTAKLLSYLYYTPSGETVEYSTQEESAPMPIVPDTVGDAYDRVLCPIVWRKQEENRIRNESKALDSDTVPAKEEDKSAAPAKSSLKDNRATPVVKTPKPPAPPKNPDGKLPPNVHLPEKNAPVSIPEPQILQNLDNLY